jgi:hypothetical protein
MVVLVPPLLLRLLLRQHHVLLGPRSDISAVKR